MNNRILLPELENPITSNYKKESFTGGLPCLIPKITVATIGVAVWILT
ncbi:MAG: hypothetical protein JKY44_06270 [Flavobacteriaceae bacterium]|nr:hypothetical protein [Flavobacteriaceae bacterium]